MTTGTKLILNVSSLGDYRSPNPGPGVVAPGLNPCPRILIIKGPIFFIKAKFYINCIKFLIIKLKRVQKYFKCI